VVFIELGVLLVSAMSSRLEAWRVLGVFLTLAIDPWNLMKGGRVVHETIREWSTACWLFSVLTPGKPPLGG
jgi:hypothetical protein